MNDWTKVDVSHSMKPKADYRITKESVARVRKKDLPWKVIEAVFRDWGLCPASQRPKFLRSLTPGQRAFLFIGNLESQIQGDGFFLYLWNIGDEVPEVLAALRLLGAKEYFPIFQSALRMFKSRAAMKGARLRRASLDMRRKAQIDDRFQKVYDDLNESRKTSLHSYLLAYLKQHPDDFFVPVEAAQPASADEPGYCLPREKVAKLRGERLHWALVEPMWDDYFEARRAGEDKLSEFLAKLSRGHRALVAINIFTKNILHLGGFRAELANEFSRDALFHHEVHEGYILLGATDYARLVESAISQNAGTRPKIEALAAKRKENFAERERRKLRVGTRAMADHLSRFMGLLNEESAIQQQLDAELNRLSTEFERLCHSRKTRIEGFVESYVASHPEEFFRD